MFLRVLTGYGVGFRGVPIFLKLSAFFALFLAINDRNLHEIRPEFHGLVGQKISIHFNSRLVASIIILITKSKKVKENTRFFTISRNLNGGINRLLPILEDP